MIPNLSSLLMIIQLQAAMNTPHERTKRSPIDLKPNHQLYLSHNGNLINPPLSEHSKSPNGFDRKKKAPFIPLEHQYLLPHQLLVLPAQSSVHHTSVHTGIIHVTTGNARIPIISQTVHHMSSNITHPTRLVPILVPYHHNLITNNHQLFFHDLSVIPLHHPNNIREANIGHGRSVEKRSQEDDEPLNRFRAYFGGFGNGLYFGGHGAGHGFYAHG